MKDLVEAARPATAPSMTEQAFRLFLENRPAIVAHLVKDRDSP